MQPDFVAYVNVEYGGRELYVNLPEDYKGERHIVVAKELPSQNGQEWVEFEEVLGPDPNPTQAQQQHRPQYSVPMSIDVMFV